MLTYLRFCGVYSLFFFLSSLGFHNTLVEGYTSISDKTKIDYCLFPRRQVFSLGIRLTRLTIPRSAGLSKGEALSFLSGFSAWHYFGIWVSFISQITCLHSPTKKQQLLMCLHPLTTKWRLTGLRSLKIHLVLAFFGSFFLSTHYSRRFASPLTHTWLIESEVLPCPYHIVMIERVEERRPLPLPLFCNSCLLLSSADGQRVAAPFPTTRWMYGGYHISSSQDTFSCTYCASLSCQTSVLVELHEKLCHPGVSRLLNFVRSRNLPFSTDVKKTCASCRICAELKPQFYRSAEGTLMKATCPIQRINIDFKGPLPIATRKRYLLVNVDEYSWFSFLYACTDMQTSAVINCLELLFSMSGMPEYIHSDRAGSFISQKLKEYPLKNGLLPVTRHLIIHRIMVGLNGMLELSGK